MLNQGEALVSRDVSGNAFDQRVRANQQQLGSDQKESYDFIVCGSGSSGSVVARRLAENSKVSVLLLEAGGVDTDIAVTDAANWPGNLGSERDWSFHTRPSQHLNGRSLLWSMGKVLGGGSSINAMIWSRGHKSDWEYFAAESGNAAWSYQEVLKIYQRIEDWHGESDGARRGTGGLLFVQPAPDPNPIAVAILEGARSLGLPIFADQNGALMEADGGCALANLRIRGGKRLSIFRTYVYPYMDRPNLTVMTGALVTRVLLEGVRAVGVEVEIGGQVQRIAAAHEVILSLGAINTPKVLMQSGIGDDEHLRRFGIRTVQQLRGVGQNLQEHVLMAGCVWEYREPLPLRNNACEAVLFAKSCAALPSPDLQSVSLELPIVSSGLTNSEVPPTSWCLCPGVVRGNSRGRLLLTGPNPADPLDIDANLLSEPSDLQAAVIAVQLCRDIGNSAALRPLTKREVLPGNLCRCEMENFVRNATVPFWHQTCTAKMGRDEMSVVDGELKVYGVSRLRVADGSVMPRVTTGNTMAPCVIIGERAAEWIRRDHGV